jgi:hypothetical protein
MREIRPYRQTRTPQPCTVVNPFDAPGSAQLILKRIHALTFSRGGRCYLFVDPCAWVYVVAEDRAAAQHWMRERLDWWRGTFSSHATIEDVLAELAS